MKAVLTVIIFSTLSVSAWSQERCSSIFTDSKIIQSQSENAGAAFLYERNSQIASQKWVETLAQKSRYGAKLLTQPIEKVDAFLRHLSYLRDRSAGQASYVRMRDRFVRASSIKPHEVPESYYAQQLELAREAGVDIKTISPAERLRLAEIVIKDQQRSLEIWVDRLTSPDMVAEPMWVKYWVLNGVMSIGKYDPASGAFSSRGKKQVAPFAELNQAALKEVVKEIKAKVNKKPTEVADEVFEQFLGSGNFGKLYGRSLYLQVHSEASHFKITEGQWRQFKKGEDPKDIVDSLCGMGTGWCTMYPETAKEQLSKGDFHIFYSQNKLGQAVHPRIAIRMEGAKIKEIRGVDKNQNMDPHIEKTDVLSRKLVEFGDEGTLYVGRMQAMAKLKDLLVKTQKKEELQKDELEFLYEIKTPIIGFGHERPPVLRDIKQLRNAYRDYSRIYNVPEKLISITLKDAISGTKTLHVGNIESYFDPLPVGTLRVEGNVAVDSFAKYPDQLTAHAIVILSGDTVANTKLIAPLMSISEVKRIENSMLRVNSLGIQGSIKSFAGARLELFEGSKFDLSFEQLKFDDFPWPQNMTSLRLKGSNAEKLHLPEGLKEVELEVESISGLRIPQSLKKIHISSGRLSLFASVSEVVLSYKAAVRFPDRFEGDISFNGASEVRWPLELSGVIKIQAVSAKKLLSQIPENLRSQVQILN